MGTVLMSRQKVESNQDLTGMMKSIDLECRNCAPTSPLECIGRCQVYKLKNELRNLREIMNSPGYLRELFNVLKNETRFHLLQAIVNGGCSVDQLQRILRKIGHSYSRQNLSEEYLYPLIRVGLAKEVQDEYSTTMFGGRLTELIGNSPEIVEMLPVHSEGYEETLLQSLLSGPKTFESIEALTSQKIASRALKRLRSVGLVESTSDRNYIFFFKSKRDPKKETLRASEKRVYSSLTEQGNSAGAIAKKTGLSLRRTYKSIRGLKGKKLIFFRRIPKVYALTHKGEKVATLLQGLQQIVEDTWNSSKQIMQDSALTLKAGLSDNVYLAKNLTT